MAVLVRVENKKGFGMYSGHTPDVSQRAYHAINKIGNQHRVRWHDNPFGQDNTRYAFNSKRVFKEVLKGAGVTEQQLMEWGYVIKFIKLDKKDRKRLDEHQTIFAYDKANVIKTLGDA